MRYAVYGMRHGIPSTKYLSASEAFFDRRSFSEVGSVGGQHLLPSAFSLEPSTF